MPGIAIALSFKMPLVKYKTFKYNVKNDLQPLEIMRVIVHSPYELPSYMGQEFFQAQKLHTSVIVKPEMYVIDESLHSLSPDERNCFLPNEKALKYFKVYTKKNCEQECLSEMIYRSCRCVPFYMISETD
jgi:hypothetical protein